MINKENFVAYEYKEICVKGDSVAMYSDCLNNFGWKLFAKHEAGVQQAQASLHTASGAGAYSMPSTQAAGHEMMTLKFKRDRKISNKNELDNLGRKCEEALAAISGLERKRDAYTMGTALSIGIVGTVFLGIAAYNFASANIVVGVLFAAIGGIGWAAGFYANRIVGKKKAAQTEPMIQEQLNIAHSACEQAHKTLA